MPLSKPKQKKMKWKGNDQRCCVLISIGNKTYQVSLEEEGQRAIAFILPHLFKDGIIKVLPEELPITLPTKRKK